jgi:pimeloyl-ACP methyl ester carboxylesterase
VRALRGVDRVHLAAWSLGGPRAGGYAARYPDKVASVILLSPAYSRTRAAGPPPRVPARDRDDEAVAGGPRHALEPAGPLCRPDRA